jgi:hypothetical protein
VLVLLIVSVGVHFALTGLGLVFFGAEGFRNPSFWDARFSAGPLTLSGQAIIVFMAALALIARAVPVLRAHAARQGAARHGGQPARRAADGHLDARARALSFGLAAFIGALTGLLIGSTTTMLYDSGFLIGLKGFVAAIFGGSQVTRRRARRAVRRTARILRLVLGQRLQGSDRLHRDHPVLLWRSFLHGHHDEEEVNMRRAFFIASVILLAAAAAAAGARVLDHPGQLHRPVRAGRHRAVLLTGVAASPRSARRRLSGIGAYAAAYLTLVHWRVAVAHRLGRARA